MNKAFNFSIFLALLAGIAGTIHLHLYAQTMRPLEIDDLFRIRRVSDPQLSPDGKWVAFVVTDVNKPENKSNSDVYVVPSGGGKPRKLTTGPGGDSHPRWSPDGKTIAFVSGRSGSSQIWMVDVGTGIEKQFTSISTGASAALWSPDGKSIAFISSVYPEFSYKPYGESDGLNKAKDDERAASKVKARIYDRLLHRHWNEWSEGKRQHIIIMPLDGGEPRDITPGDRDAVPTSSTFSAGDDFGFSPDSREIAYTATPTPPRSEAWSTNHDIFIVDIRTGERRLLTPNEAADSHPVYSPDGRYIAYLAQSRPGFEADRWQLTLYDRAAGETRSLTPEFDAGIESIVWTRDGKKIYFSAAEKGNKPIWSLSVENGEITRIAGDAVMDGISVSPDGGLLLFSLQTIVRPAEIYTLEDGKTLRKITHFNDSLFAGISFKLPEYVTYTGAGGTSVQMWIMKPPSFDPAKKYPLVFWVHGGPQGAWMNSWSYRWNALLWAAQGYIMALPNPRGSTGFGQKFTDEISHDWGGKVFEDLMAGLSYMENLAYVDTSRMAAAGASYGGYMMNWFQGHTDKFKTLITHCGTFNFENSYGATDELWFDEWEHGIPWETPDYNKFSPHKYAANFKTPNLIIHNELDFRIPYDDGLSLFTTLQRKGIPSKLLTFPDEGHWVLKPLNSELWHKTVFEWLETYLKR